MLQRHKSLHLFAYLLNACFLFFVHQAVEAQNGHLLHDHVLFGLPDTIFCQVDATERPFAYDFDKIELSNLTLLAQAQLLLCIDRSVEVVPLEFLKIGFVQVLRAIAAFIVLFCPLFALAVSSFVVVVLDLALGISTDRIRLQVLIKLQMNLTRVRFSKLHLVWFAMHLTLKELLLKRT